MNRMMWKMWRSGYSEKSRREIMVAGLKGFKRLEDLEKVGKRSLNRRRAENWASRKLKKYSARTSWYKKGRYKEQVQGGDGGRNGGEIKG